jgi:hypothetical protein
MHPSKIVIDESPSSHVVDGMAAIPILLLKRFNPEDIENSSPSVRRHQTV